MSVISVDKIVPLLSDHVWVESMQIPSSTTLGSLGINRGVATSILQAHASSTYTSESITTASMAVTFTRGTASATTTLYATRVGDMAYITFDEVTIPSGTGRVLANVTMGSTFMYGTVLTCAVMGSATTTTLGIEYSVYELNAVTGILIQPRTSAYTYDTYTYIYKDGDAVTLNPPIWRYHLYN